MNILVSIEPFSWQSFLFNIVFTLLIYMLPINFYRFVIRKKPLPSKNAAVICYAYGFSIWLLLSTFYYIIGYKEVANIAAAGIWSTVNYYILRKGYSSSSKKHPLSNKQEKHLTIEFVSIARDFISKINTLFPNSIYYIVNCEAIVYVYIQFIMHFSTIKNNEFDEATVVLNDIIKNKEFYFDSAFNKKQAPKGWDFDTFFQERIVDYVTATKNFDILLGQSVYQIMSNQQISKLRKSPLLRSNLLFMDYIYYYVFLKKIPKLKDLEPLLIVDFAEAIKYSKISIKMADEISCLMKIVDTTVSNDLYLD